MDIATTLVGTSSSASGKAYWRRRTATSLTSSEAVEMAQPSGFNLTDTQGVWATYNGNLFGVGLGTDNVIIDRFFRFMRLGMAAPTSVPVLAAAAGPGTTGSCRVAYAWYDEKLDEWSPLSGISNEVNLSNNARTVSNIDTSDADGRATHVGIFVSMDNASFRLSTKRQIGVSSVTEGVATLALGFAFPATFTRFPLCATVVFYHKRLVMAGDFMHPDTLYVSVPGFPERYGGLSFKTENGEPIVALAVAENDVCLVMTPSSTYELRGWRDNDMSLKLKDPDVGSCTKSVAIARGKPIVANRYGIWFYNGGWHNIVQDRQKEWLDFYEAYSTAVEQSFAVVDPNTYTYRLFVSTGFGTLSSPETQFHVPNISGGTIRTLVWRANLAPLLPQVSGQMGQPHWSYDVMCRAVDTAALLNLPGSKRADVHLGFCDGYIRYDDADDGDDDGDTYAKRMWIRTKAYDMGDPGGSFDEGKELKRLWTYLESDGDWTLYCHGGDEYAWKIETALGVQLLPENTDRYWKDPVTGEPEVLIGTYVYPQKTVYYHKPQRVCGRCFTFDITASSPTNMRFRGLGGVYGPGRVTRGPIGEEEGPIG